MEEHVEPPLLESLGGAVSTALVGLRLPPRGLGRPTSRQSVLLPDGGTVRLTWWRAGDVTVVVLPGLNSTSDLPVVRHAAAHFYRLGYTVAVLDYRGHAGQPFTAAKVFGADAWVDLPTVFAAVRANMMDARAPILALGHSMGGATLIKYLSETPRDQCEVAAAATVSAPINLSAHQKRLESSPKWRAANLIVMSLTRLHFYSHWLMYPESRPHLTRMDWAALRRATSLRELEYAAICKINGFADPEEYYAFGHASIPNIDVPLLVAHAQDDPVIGWAELPLTKLLSNPKVTLALSPTGGHLGYRDPGGGGSWVYKTIATHFAKSVCRSWLPLPARGSEAATVHARL